MNKPPSSMLAMAVKIYLDIGWYAGLVGIALLLLITPFFLVALPSMSETPDLSVLARFAFDTGREGEALSGADPEGLLRGQGELRLFTRSRIAWSWFLASIVTVLAVTLFIFWQLRRVMRSVLAGRPFASKNAWRIRIVGFVVVISQLAVPLAKYLIGRVILAEVALEGLALRPPIDVEPNGLFLGLAIVVLGEIFHRAAQLQREQSLTV